MNWENLPGQDAWNAGGRGRHTRADNTRSTGHCVHSANRQDNASRQWFIPTTKPFQPGCNVRFASHYGLGSDWESLKT